MASVLASLVLRRQYRSQADLLGSLSKPADTRQSSVDFLLPPVYLRDDPRYGAAVPSNDERFSALDVIEQLRQSGFGI
jgi:hypothetical protein